MGMDLDGKNPKNEKGEYFRNNVWWWRPLWDYVCTEFDTILTEEDHQMGHYNDGHFIDNDKAIKLAFALYTAIQDGSAENYVKGYDKHIKSLPEVECSICNGKGTRDDEYVKGTCNACKGKGTRPDWGTNYPMSIENLQNFAEFCENSGGFEIY